MLNSILNTVRCNLIKWHICDYQGSNKQLYHLSLYPKNCIKIYINDVLVPKQNSYLADAYKDSQSIKVKLVGVFNNQTHFLEVKSKSIDVNIPFFKKKNILTAIESTNVLSHKNFSISSLIKEKKIREHKNIEKTDKVSFSKTAKLNSELKNQKYNLTNINNTNEQEYISNT